MSYWRKKEVTLYVSISKLTGNNKSKLWKNYGWAYRPEMTVISDFVHTSNNFWVRHSTQFQERLERTFWLSAYVVLLIDLHFICWLIVLLFLFHYERTTKSKFIFYAIKENGCWTWKHKDGLERDGKAGEVSSVMSVVQNFKIIVWPDPIPLRVRKYAKFGVFYAKIVQMTLPRLWRESLRLQKFSVTIRDPLRLQKFLVRNTVLSLPFLQQIQFTLIVNVANLN